MRIATRPPAAPGQTRVAARWSGHREGPGEAGRDVVSLADDLAPLSRLTPLPDGVLVRDRHEHWPAAVGASIRRQPPAASP